MLQQLVGNRAALNVTADADQLTAAAAAALREPNRLDWCVSTTKAGTVLLWADCHRRDRECNRPHVIDHQCTAPPEAARPRRTTRKASVPEGQLTLG
ncbi:hypothetical protein ACFWHV_32295 [Streptomyces collinus]|uniref:hypothetical protein n=1 Tax=Streptomyces collinus TaxID=42684 RepID=UPI0036479BF6